MVDQPHRGGGEDTAPAPLELLGAALGTCVALYVQQFCEARALPYDGLRIEVEQHGATSPNRVERFVVRVLLAHDLRPQYTSMLERVARSCPVHNTLGHGAEVEVSVESPVSVV
jgi:putative redox protein